jgi:cytochrome c-type biogenesis protein
MADSHTVGMLAAFAAGGISFLSPCVLPLVPAYVTYVAGEGAVLHETARRSRLRALATSVPFVLGFSAVFIAFGASATALGRVLQRYHNEANLIAAIVVIAMGLAMLGLTRWMPWLDRDLRPQWRVATGTPWAALALGMAFAFGWTPCIGPVLAAILALTAIGSGGNGIGLLGAYSLGLGLPLLATALFIDRATGTLRRLRVAGGVLRVVGGLVMVAMGLAMLSGRLTTFSLWLLEAFPALASIG